MKRRSGTCAANCHQRFGSKILKHPKIPTRKFSKPENSRIEIAIRNAEDCKAIRLISICSFKPPYLNRDAAVQVQNCRSSLGGHWKATENPHVLASLHTYQQSALHYEKSSHLKAQA